MGRYSERLRGRMAVRRTEAPLDAMDEREFLARRRMFRVDPAGPVFAPEGRGGNHRAWMADLDEAAFRRTPRGYLLDGDLVFYVGGFEPAPTRAILSALPGLVETGVVTPSTLVWTGARERAKGALSGVNRMGTVADLLVRSPRQPAGTPVDAR